MLTSLFRMGTMDLEGAGCGLRIAAREAIGS